jgi:hypothetical protein
MPSSAIGIGCSGAVVYAVALEQLRVDGRAGKVSVAGGAGVTVIVVDPVRALPQSSTPV